MRILHVSVLATVALAIAGVVVGLAATSTAIVFDGVYGLADAAMTALALGVARLIAASNAADASGGRLHERFTMGFWHLEPMVLGLNGVLLTGAAIYALLNAVGSILVGGRVVSFDAAIADALARLRRHLWFERIVMSAKTADVTEPVAPELQGILDAVCYAP